MWPVAVTISGAMGMLASECAVALRRRCFVVERLGYSLLLRFGLWL